MPMNTRDRAASCLSADADLVPFYKLERLPEVMPDAPEKRKGKLRLVRAIPVSISLTPLQLLGVILKAVLKDRITDQEIDRICSVYYATLRKWFG
jgi:hypothetical protein